MQKIKETFKKVYNYVEDKVHLVDTYSNVFFRFIARNPKTTTAIWAFTVYLTWRLS